MRTRAARRAVPTIFLTSGRWSPTDPGWWYQEGMNTPFPWNRTSPNHFVDVNKIVRRTLTMVRVLKASPAGPRRSAVAPAGPNRHRLNLEQRAIEPRGCGVAAAEGLFAPSHAWAACRP